MAKDGLNCFFRYPTFALFFRNRRVPHLSPLLREVGILCSRRVRRPCPLRSLQRESLPKTIV
jgi:hypothetical protein